MVLPLIQVTVPPVAKAADDMGTELPPVFPPVHPLRVIVPETVPLKPVQVMPPPAQA